MEILQTDDKLREEIINDAKIKAERIIKKAKREAEEIIRNADLQIESTKKEYEKNTLGEAEDLIKLIFASIDIEVRKNITSISGDIVDEVFDRVKKSILENKKFNYQNFMFKLIQNSSSEIKASSYVVEINNEELKKISKKALLNLELQDGKIKDTMLANIDNGLMFYSADKKTASYVSINIYIEGLKKRTRTNVYEILIKGKEQCKIKPSEAR